MNNKPVYVIASDKMGQGDPDLGDILIRGMFKNLTQVRPGPQVVIFLNSGVKLLTRPDIFENIQALEEQGTKILVCGTCVKYYNLQEEIQDSYISNMKEIVTTMNNAPKVVQF